MEVKNKTEVTGKVRLQVLDTSGNVLKDTGFMENIITNAGKAQLALLAYSAAAVPFTYLAVGTSSTAVAATDTTLGAEITDSGLARASATVTSTTTTTTNDTMSMTYTWTVSGTKTIQEIGNFNASSSGTMLGHKLTGAVPVVSGNLLVATYTVSFT